MKDTEHAAVCHAVVNANTSRHASSRLHNSTLNLRYFCSGL